MPAASFTAAGSARSIAPADGAAPVSARRLRVRLGGALALVLVSTGPAAGATRSFSVAAFRKLAIAGPYRVSVTAGPPSARIEGAADTLDAVAIDATGETLFVRGNASADNGHPAGPVTVELSTPALAEVQLVGAGSAMIDRLAGDKLAAVLAGDGNLNVGVAKGGSLIVTVRGSGTATLAGEVPDVRLLYSGTGVADLHELAVHRLAVLASGSGRIEAAASETATVQVQGALSVHVAGPARCTVKNSGGATVACGGG